VEGVIPAELEGTLFRNGPGLLEIGGTKLNQPFDGDGMVLRIALRGGAAHVANAFVRTAGYVAEQAAGRMLFKGAFATGNPSGGWFYNPFDFSVKNVANTHVALWGGRLWALWEGGLPHELDPSTLQTLRESDWDGAITGGGPFAAHYRVLGGDTLVNFGVKTAGEDAQVTFYEFDAAAKLRRKSGVTLRGAGFAFFHDFLVTDNYYVLFQNPVKLDTKKLITEYMFAKCSIAECLVFDPSRDMRVHLIPRPGAAQRAAAAGAPPPAQREYALPPHFVFHHVNAYERAADAPGGPPALVCDSVAWRAIDFSNSLATLGPGYYGADASYRGADQRSEAYRYTFELAPGGTASRARLAQRPLEFPAVAPASVGRRHAHAYACGAAVDHPLLWGPAQTLVKLSAPPGAPADAPPAEAAVWAPGPRKFTQEPVFVPRPGATAEDDGWLLALVYDAEAPRTELVILDARRVQDGPVATLRLRHVVPFGLHGSWADAYLGPAAAPPQSAAA
jgi:all-trans-8'-apo-beta-carotenal 15,15'-oxygenase